MLKQRIITAAILIPLFMAVLFFLPAKAFLFVTAILALYAAWEWAGLSSVKTIPEKILYLLLMVMAFYNVMYVPINYVLAVAAIFWVIAAVLVGIYPRGSKVWCKGMLIRAVLGFLVLVPCWVAINFMRYQVDGLIALIFLFVLIWGSDITAYFVGKKWGKRPLAKKVSPGKTVEGVIGALIYGIVFSVLALWLFKTPYKVWAPSIALSVLTIVFGIIGDLFESVMKRQRGVKDSGKLLPGHGGALDRIDSLTAAAPIFALGAWILGNYFS